MTGHWVCQTQAGQTAHDTEQAADREAMRLHPTQAVVWYCTDVEPAPAEPAPATEPIVDRVLTHLGLKIPKEGAA